jgi:hypothetical protein
MVSWVGENTRSISALLSELMDYITCMRFIPLHLYNKKIKLTPMWLTGDNHNMQMAVGNKMGGKNRCSCCGLLFDPNSENVCTCSYQKQKESEKIDLQTAFNHSMKIKDHSDIGLNRPCGLFMNYNTDRKKVNLNPNLHKICNRFTYPLFIYFGINQNVVSSATNSYSSFFINESKLKIENSTIFYNFDTHKIKITCVDSNNGIKDSNCTKCNHSNCECVLLVCIYLNRNRCKLSLTDLGLENLNLIPDQSHSVNGCIKRVLQKLKSEKQFKIDILRERVSHVLNRNNSSSIELSHCDRRMIALKFEDIHFPHGKPTTIAKEHDNARWILTLLKLITIITYLPTRIIIQDKLKWHLRYKVISFLLLSLSFHRWGNSFFCLYIHNLVVHLEECFKIINFNQVSCEKHEQFFSVIKHKLKYTDRKIDNAELNRCIRANYEYFLHLHYPSLKRKDYSNSNIQKIAESIDWDFNIIIPDEIIKDKLLGEDIDFFIESIEKDYSQNIEKSSSCIIFILGKNRNSSLLLEGVSMICRGNIEETIISKCKSCGSIDIDENCCYCIGCCVMINRMERKNVCQFHSDMVQRGIESTNVKELEHATVALNGKKKKNNKNKKTNIKEKNKNLNVSCTCKGTCQRNCPCKKNNSPCTDKCVCNNNKCKNK